VHIPISSIEVKTKDEILRIILISISTVIDSIWFVIRCLQTYNTACYIDLPLGEAISYIMYHISNFPAYRMSLMLIRRLRQKNRFYNIQSSYIT